jgi:hypothetical protein
MSRIIIAIVFFSVIAHSIEAQSECAQLLKFGVFSHVKEASNFDSYEQVQSSLCEIYDQYKREGMSSSVKARYKVIFKGGASFSNEQVEKTFKLYCEENMEISEDSRFTTFERRFVDPALMDAYVECVEANKNGIIFEMRPTDEYFRQVTFVLKPKGGGPFPDIKSVSWDEDKLEVKNDELYQAALAKEELNEAYTFRVERIDIRNKPFSDGIDSLLAPAHNLDINIDNEVYIIKFPSIPHDVNRGQGPKYQSGFTDMGFMVSATTPNPEWSLHEGKGTRYALQTIEFPESFDEVPELILTVNSWDAGNTANFRFTVDYKNLTREGFTLEYRTWDDSKIYGAVVQWIALIP